MAIDYRTGDYRDLAGERWDYRDQQLRHASYDRAQIDDFLRFMEAESALGWMVNDLHRHRFAWYGFPLLARLMRWHPIVREDGRLSIARSFRPAEWQAMLGGSRRRRGAASCGVSRSGCASNGCDDAGR